MLKVKLRCDSSIISYSTRLQVNDVDISEATHNEAVQVLSNAGDTVKMIILRESEELAESVTENGVEEPKPEPTEVRVLHHICNWI